EPDHREHCRRLTFPCALGPIRSVNNRAATQVRSDRTPLRRVVSPPTDRPLPAARLVGGTWPPSQKRATAFNPELSGYRKFAKYAPWAGRANGSDRPTSRRKSS